MKLETLALEMALISVPGRGGIHQPLVCGNPVLAFVALAASRPTFTMPTWRSPRAMRDIVAQMSTRAA